MLCVNQIGDFGIFKDMEGNLCFSGCMDKIGVCEEVSEEGWMWCTGMESGCSLIFLMYMYGKMKLYQSGGYDSQAALLFVQEPDYN
jgi:hypothetical protein